ncbi:hypothetical protein ACPXCE_01755 [Streptomyces sp. DT24]|uniref:hypothetical protein n=1 Tax=unclassified Streptomyces TaxID=2593676 RepID=UPI0023B9BC1D|nr:hypothetical protein [Streptomyces sp. AM 4-1-1]WEH36739.1 hypothetical protein PZB75_27330 [Streptomyces sp. AM 4-1-1]
MVLLALLVPPVMMCVLLAMGRYEERVFAEPRHEPAHAARPRHLRVVPDLPSASAATDRSADATSLDGTRRAA